MALVALDGMPLVAIGHAGKEGSTTLSGASNTTLDAANEACIMFGYVFTEDGAAHTLDTSGSSSIGWRSGTVTFANAGTTVKVGLAAVDTATGPPARAVNSTDVITFDVSKSHTGGGGGVTSGAWQTNVPDAGTKTVAHGDLIALAIQMTARGGVDIVNVHTQSTNAGSAIPGVTEYVGGAYSIVNKLPNAVITFSDGTLGFFYGGAVFTDPANTTTWNSSSSPNEYGNVLQLPSPGKAYGMIVNCSVAGNAEFVLYSDPLGTPVAERTVAVDLNTVSSSGTNRWFPILFASPYSFNARQPTAVIMKPTSGTNIVAPYKRFDAAAHQKSETLGTNCYAVSRSSGAFAVVNSNKDRFAVGLLVGAFEHGVWPSGYLGG